jgi:glycerol-3-phosphate dehydrogenase
VDFGLVPCGERSQLIDHRLSDGIAGLVTTLSVRYAAARLDATNALGCVMKQIYRKEMDPFNPASVAASVENPERAARNRSAFEALPGGEFDDFERLLAHSRRNRPSWLPAASIDALVANFGTHMHRVVAMADADPSLRRCIAGSHVTLAELAYSVRDEMVQRLGDVVFRRTELGTGGHPGEAAIAEVSRFMQQARGWSAKRTAEERRAVNTQFERYFTAIAEPETEPDLLRNVV